MHRLFVIGLAILTTGCETINAKAGLETDSIRAIYSEAGGISSVITGRVSSCTVVQSKATPAKVKSLSFGEDKCEIELGAE